MTLNKQRVTIQYSIYMDELEGEVRKLVNKSQRALTAIQPLDAAKKNLLSHSTMEEIEETRMALANVDNILMDISTIVEGYMNFVTQKDKTPDVRRPDVPSDEEDILEHLDTLRSQIANFKQSNPSNNIEEDSGEVTT